MSAISTVWVAATLGTAHYFQEFQALRTYFTDRVVEKNKTSLEIEKKFTEEILLTVVPQKIFHEITSLHVLVLLFLVFNIQDGSVFSVSVASATALVKFCLQYSF